MKIISIMTCLATGISIMGFAPMKWRIIGAVIVFFGCWLICLHVQLRRINREIDRFENMERTSYLLSPRRLSKGRRDQLAKPQVMEPVIRRLSHLTNSFSRVILLDSGARKA